MAKKQAKTASSGVDMKALALNILKERERIIQYGKGLGFEVKVRKGVFIVWDSQNKTGPFQFVSNKSLSAETYGSFVTSYMNKVRNVS